MCEECYSDENRITPLLNPLDCLENQMNFKNLLPAKKRDELR